MEVKNRIRDIFSYLLSIKNISGKVIRDIYDYDKVYYEADLCHMGGCKINKDLSKDWWMQVNRKAKALYDQFFRLYQDLQKRGEDIEIVWGNALLAWNINGTRILHPIFVTKMELIFEPREGKFILKPFGRTEMELNYLEGLNIPNIDKLFELKENARNYNIDPRFTENIQDILIQTVHYLSSNINREGEFYNNMMGVNKIKLSQSPVFYNCPSIIIRKNDISLWQEELKNIIKSIDLGCEIPNTLRALIDDSEIIIDEAETKEWRKVGQDILFPLPANSEQKEIIKSLSNNFGVVVQGPPGTGKSHTIVNLVCHLLAHGKRVLVTSQTDRALKVLANKIPKQIKPLCINFLGNDTKSLEELEEAVCKITDNLSLRPEDILKEILPLENDLRLCRKKQEELYKTLKNIEEKERENINYLGKNYKVMDMAKWVNENREKYSWIEDDIRTDIRIPISEEEFNEYTHLLSILSKEDIRISNKINSMLNKLPDIEEITLKEKRYLELKKHYSACKEKVANWYITRENKCDYDKLINLARVSKEAILELEDGKLSKIYKLYYKSEIAFDTLNEMLLQAQLYLNKIGEIKPFINNHIIDIPNCVTLEKLDEDFRLIYKVLKEKGKIGNMFKLTHKKIKYIIDQCKVDNRCIENTGQGELIKRFIEYRMIVKSLNNLWNNSIRELDDSLINNEEDNLIFLENSINNIKDISKWDRIYKEPIIRDIGTIVLPKDMDWHDSNTYDYFIDCLMSIKLINEFDELNASLDVIKRLIKTTGELDKLCEGLYENDLNKIKDGYKYVEKLIYIRRDVEYINRVSSILKQLCPRLNDKLFKETDFNEYKEWEMAWKWKQWDTFIKSKLKLDIDDVYMDLQAEKERERIFIEEIVSKKTWHNQILRITETQKRSLISWVQAVKRIGKGTGKYSAEYRKIAQNEMENCKEVIPVWIMPLNKVIENIKLSNSPFDVIIFDESSQSDIFAISALMRSRRAVIVGDDRQISPEAVGVERAQVQQLINSYLTDIPNKEWFDMQTSLYDTALRIFPSRLMLKEHFRCVPEIIQFSNKFCYSNSIIPLRHPLNSEMLLPPVATIRVKDGKRDEKKSINIPEAEALANKIMECCRDNKYNGMTMGVISLLGESQAEVIQNMLRDKIGEEEMVNRKIICGDAYSFQGDERDIMFLSLVIANNIKYTSLTKDSDIRRFNVAASRAKNQMWLFHSVDLDDISLDCVRYSLLSYCINYDKYNDEFESFKYVFHSKFKKDVYKAIKENGYKVIPDVKVGKCSIDFVIEGLRARLGLICNGDELVSVDNWESRFMRQLELQKAGWNFKRVRASEFYYNREKVINSIISKLNEINIENNINVKQNNNILKEVAIGS